MSKESKREESRFDSPYGKFVSEKEKRFTTPKQELSLVFHRFEKGILVTILQGNSRLFSEFIPKEEDYGETEEEYDTHDWE